MNKTIFDRLLREEYDRWGKEIPDQAWCNEENTRKEVSFLLNGLQLKKSDKILDLFCSWGRHIHGLAKQGFQVTGVDISKALITMAKSLAMKKGFNCKLFIGDLETMQFPYKFDVIYSMHSSLFEPWRKPEEIYELIYIVKTHLETGGRYLFGWNNNYNRSDVAEKRWRKVLREAKFKTYDNVDLPFTYYSYNEQSELIKKCGFKIQKVFNDYISTQPYSESKPGLIFLVEK